MWGLSLVLHTVVNFIYDFVRSDYLWPVYVHYWLFGFVYTHINQNFTLKAYSIKLFYGAYCFYRLLKIIKF